MATALGGGSGIDMVALANSLAKAQFQQRLDRIDRQNSDLEKRISLAGALRSQVLQLATSVGDRVRQGDLSSNPALANPSVATATRGTGIPASGYTLEVTALATAQTLAGPALTSATAPTGSGTLTLRFGSISGGAFTADSARQAVSINVASGATLNDLANSINAANSGVSAYVATGANGSHLMLKGQDGAANAFALEATETAGDPGLARFAWNPASPGSMHQSSAAGNASLKLDGLQLTSATNTLTDIAPGLSLKLTDTNAGSPTTIRFSEPTTAVKGFMQDMVGALNELVSSLNKGLDPNGGELAGDAGARALRRSLASLTSTVIMPGAGTDKPSTLSDLGLALNRDGTFRLDTTRLEASLKNAPAEVGAMFTTGVNGVYGTLDRISRGAAAVADPGSLGGSVTRYTARKKQLTDSQTALADAQEKLRGQLVQRFTGADKRIGASRSTLSFLQGQISAWNGSRN